MFSFINKCANKFLRYYRRSVFKKNIIKSGENLKILGPIYLVNTNIKCGDNVTIYPNVQFFGDGEIVIEDYVAIGNNSIIYASKQGGITIGERTSIAANSYIIDANHGIKLGTPIQLQENSCSKIVIGKDVWIGAGCNIIKGSTLNNGCVIGASSLVNSEIPPNAIAVGSPAKVVKYRVP